MNSRQKRKYRSYGMSVSEAMEVIAELKKMESKPRKGHCSYMDYHVIDQKHRDIIDQAKRMYLCGKHAGSKSTKLLKVRIATTNKQFAKYSTALKAMERIENRQKAIEAENVD